MENSYIYIETKEAKLLSEYKFPRFNELPDEAMYMEQLIEYLDKYLLIFKVPDDEKVITSTMVNNYVKQKVIEPPIKKKYLKPQLVRLIAIGVLKQVLSISEVSQILKLQIEQYNVEVAYTYFCTELEAVLRATFGTRKFSEDSHALKITPLSEAVRSALLAFANMIYSKKALHYFREIK